MPLPRPTAAAVAVAAGGVVGASVRWALATTLPHPGGWPWPTLAANVVGCLVLGVIAARLPFLSPRATVVVRDGLAVGFCGGLTTFSTFSVELATFLRDGRPGVAAAYLVLSLVTGFAAYDLGRRALGRRVVP